MTTNGQKVNLSIEEHLEAKTLATAEKLNSSCRLCLCPEQDVSLFSDYQNYKYFEVAMSLADIQITEIDNFPKKICVECASKLVLFFKFKMKCELSHITLTAVMKLGESINHKEECNDEDDTSYHSDSKFNIDKCELNSDDQVPITDNICESKIKGKPKKQKLKAQSLRQPKQEKRTMKKTFKPVILQCEECGRVFSRKSTLIQHRISHSGIKNFCCEICNRRFTRKSHLEIHMRIHNNIKPYVCEVCSRSFTKSGDLARHRRIHNDERNYGCEMCGKRFKRSADVITHMTSHTGFKPYSCNICDKSYTSHSSLKKHEKTHFINKQ